MIQKTQALRVTIEFADIDGVSEVRGRDRKDDIHDVQSIQASLTLFAFIAFTSFKSFSIKAVSDFF